LDANSHQSGSVFKANQHHKSGDEKRTPVIIAPELHGAWLSAEVPQATALMNWQHMPDLVACPASRT
jgi:hypothetical protein